MSKISHAPVWQLQEAKNRLSELVQAAESNGPQTITRHGKIAVMVVSMTANEKENSISAWELLRDESAAKVGGPPDLPARTLNPRSDVILPW